VVAGDWHNDIPWSRKVVGQLPELLPDERPRILLHAGDFGIWNHSNGVAFLDLLNKSLTRADGFIFFVDGNHEDLPYLHHLAGSTDPGSPVQLRERIFWLPRGYQWSGHGRTWLALGGAVSADRVDREYGVNWFPEEEITEGQTRRVMDDGPAEVMLCHDAPSRTPLPLPAPADWWDPDDLARSDTHRERLQAIVDVVRPHYLIHGHYHLEHLTMVSLDYGPLAVVGLGKNNAASGSYRVLDVRSMEFVPPC
jgi:hypothetical protein